MYDFAEIFLQLTEHSSLTVVRSEGRNLTWRTPDTSPNSAFDFEAPDWGFAGNSFDLIHAAQLCGAISSWPRFLEKIKRYNESLTARSLAVTNISRQVSSTENWASRTFRD